MFSSTPIWFWVDFNAFVLVMLALDLGVFRRKAHRVSVKEALLWSGVWIALVLTIAIVASIIRAQRLKQAEHEQSVAATGRE